MKNPNGYGTVTKLSGNRRKPWVVKEGKSGKQKPIGYTTTREEGLIMLAKYNNDPWDIETDKITLQELYDLWLEKRQPLKNQGLPPFLCLLYHKHTVFRKKCPISSTYAYCQVYVSYFIFKIKKAATL